MGCFTDPNQCSTECWETECGCNCHDGVVNHDDLAQTLSQCTEVANKMLRMEPLGDIRRTWAEWYLNQSIGLFPECEDALEPCF
jgi:hypothetical protein